jgi:hypothetical protein
MTQMVVFHFVSVPCKDMDIIEFPQLRTIKKEHVKSIGQQIPLY